MSTATRSSFRLKIALVTAAFAAIPLCSVSYVLIEFNEREVESSQQALQIAACTQAAATLDAELAAARAGLEAIAATLVDEQLDESARVALLLRLVEASPALETVAVYDLEGALIDRVLDRRTPDDRTPDDRTPDDRTPDDRTQGAAPRTPSLAPASPDTLAVDQRDGLTADAEGRVLLAIPIRAAHRTTGYLAAPLALEQTQLRAAALSRDVLASEEGRTSVLSAEGHHVAGPAVAHAPPSPEELRAAPATPVSDERVDAAGRRFITTIARVEAAPLVVVAQVPRDVVYESVDRLRWAALGTVALTLLAAFLAAFLLARRIAAPIATLVAFTRELAARRFEARVHVTSGDELETLGAALNDAAQELAASEAQIREEHAIRSDLGRYLPSELVEQVIRREQSMELGGQRTDITVLFADVVAFTPLSESLPPEQVVALLNELFSLLTEAVFRNGGTVDKFVGDCVMALFGAPAPHEDHAARALDCARDMMRFVEVANAGWRETIGVEVQLAIGLNGGEAVVGNVGSKERMEYTAIGDVVNVAARLETIARPGQILATRATLEAADETDDAARVGEREVPGRTAPVELFEVPW